MIRLKLKANKWMAPMRLLAYALILTTLLGTVCLSVPALTSAEDVFPGWDTIDTIYYDPSQDDPDNGFLEQAATEIKTHLEQVATTTFTIDTETPPGIGVFLSVDSSLPELADKNDEAFKLYTDGAGIHVVGKTPIAVRHGAYTLLEKLGFRWYFSNPVWYVTPDVLQDLRLDDVQEPYFIQREIGNRVLVKSCGNSLPVV